jgi:hypothetical protein
MYNSFCKLLGLQTTRANLLDTRTQSTAKPWLDKLRRKVQRFQNSNRKKRNTFYEAPVGPRLGRARRPLNGEISGRFYTRLENIEGKSELFTLSGFSALKNILMQGAFFKVIIVKTLAPYWHTRGKKWNNNNEAPWPKELTTADNILQS